MTDFLEGKKRRIYVVNEEPRILKYYKPTLLSFLSMRKKKKQYSTRDFFLNIWETVEVRVKLYQLSDQQQNLRPNDPTVIDTSNEHQIDH